jgi:hypothetical protein
MTGFARLSHPDNTAIAVFGGADGRFTIVAGNLAEGDVPDVVRWLRREGKDFFGGIIEEGSAKGSVASRWDAFIVVEATKDRVMEFTQRKLKGGPNQIV